MDYVNILNCILSDGGLDTNNNCLDRPICSLLTPPDSPSEAEILDQILDLSLSLLPYNVLEQQLTELSSDCAQSPPPSPNAIPSPIPDSSEIASAVGSTTASASTADGESVDSWCRVGERCGSGCVARLDVCGNVVFSRGSISNDPDDCEDCRKSWNGVCLLHIDTKSPTGSPNCASEKNNDDKSGHVHVQKVPFAFCNSCGIVDIFSGKAVTHSKSAEHEIQVIEEGKVTLLPDDDMICTCDVFDSTRTVPCSIRRASNMCPLHDLCKLVDANEIVEGYQYLSLPDANEMKKLLQERWCNLSDEEMTSKSEPRVHSKLIKLENLEPAAKNNLISKNDPFMDSVVDLVSADADCVMDVDPDLKDLGDDLKTIVDELNQQFTGQEMQSSSFPDCSPSRSSSDSGTGDLFWGSSSSLADEESASSATDSGTDDEIDVTGDFSSDHIRHVAQQQYQVNEHNYFSVRQPSSQRQIQRPVIPPIRLSVPHEAVQFSGYGGTCEPRQRRQYICRGRSTRGRRGRKPSRRSHRVPNTFELDDEKRDSHNQMERERRTEQKMHLHQLKQAIPILYNKKSPKNRTLDTATEYIQHAEDRRQRLLAELAQQKRCRQNLLDMLRHYGARC